MFANFRCLTLFAVTIMFGQHFAAAQNDPQSLEWVQSGNCWHAQPGFLYCGDSHPLTENNPGTFLSLACFDNYHAILLNHPQSDVETEIRTINADFGKMKYSDIWIAASESESFFSNHIELSNDPYFNVLNGLSNPQSESFKFSIEPGEIQDVIELTGEEHQVVDAYMHMCRLR